MMGEAREKIWPPESILVHDKEPKYLEATLADKNEKRQILSLSDFIGNILTYLFDLSQANSCIFVRGT